jgi:hypothetical protein
MNSRLPTRSISASPPSEELSPDFKPFLYTTSEELSPDFKSFFNAPLDVYTQQTGTQSSHREYTSNPKFVVDGEQSHLSLYGSFILNRPLD